MEIDGQIANPATIKMCELMEGGVAAKDAILLAKGNANPSPNTISRAKAKWAKWRLGTPQMQKLAHDAIRQTLRLKPLEISKGTDDNGNEIKELIYPSHTNRIAAAAMVADRTEPITRQNVNLNLNADVAPVDLERYRNK